MPNISNEELMNSLVTSNIGLMDTESKLLITIIEDPKIRDSILNKDWKYGAVASLIVNNNEQTLKTNKTIIVFKNVNLNPISSISIVPEKELLTSTTNINHNLIDSKIKVKENQKDLKRSENSSIVSSNVSSVTDDNKEKL